MHSHYMVLQMNELKTTKVDVASNNKILNLTFTETVLLPPTTLTSVTESGSTSMDTHTVP